MKRTNDTYRLVDKFGTGKDGYTEGTPGTGADPATQWRGEMADHIQEELAGGVELLGWSLGAGYYQLSAALRAQRVADSCARMTKIRPGAADDTWTSVAFGGESSRVAGSAVDPTTAYRPHVIHAAGIDSAGQAVIATSFDGGATWSRDASLSRTGTPQCGTVARQTSVAVFGSLSGDWYRRSGDSSPTEGAISGTPGIRQICWHDAGSVWLAATSAGIYSASDSGTLTWTLRQAGDFSGVDSSGSLALGIDVNGDLYYSSDGLSWTAGDTAVFGGSPTIGTSPIAYSPQAGGFAISANDGSSWHVVHTADGQTIDWDLDIDDLFSSSPAQGVTVSRVGGILGIFHVRGLFASSAPGASASEWRHFTSTATNEAGNFMGSSDYGLCWRGSIVSVDYPDIWLPPMWQETNS